MNTLLNFRYPFGGITPYFCCPLLGHKHFLLSRGERLRINHTLGIATIICLFSIKLLWESNCDEGPFAEREFYHYGQKLWLKSDPVKFGIKAEGQQRDYSPECWIIDILSSLGIMRKFDFINSKKFPFVISLIDQLLRNIAGFLLRLHRHHPVANFEDVG